MWPRVLISINIIISWSLWIDYSYILVSQVVHKDSFLELFYNLHLNLLEATSRATSVVIYLVSIDIYFRLFYKPRIYHGKASTFTDFTLHTTCSIVFRLTERIISKQAHYRSQAPRQVLHCVSSRGGFFYLINVEIPQGTLTEFSASQLLFYICKFVTTKIEKMHQQNDLDTSCHAQLGWGRRTSETCAARAVCSVNVS